MTLGDKIKYCRNRCGISQAKLAELSGISLVSIKRYETNKAIPLPPQMKKLTDSLGISSLAFSDTYFDSLQKLETYGDLIRLLIIFHKNQIIQINGKRDKDGQIQANTSVFKLNPLIGNFFKAINNSDESTNISFCLTDKRILEKILMWENAYNKYNCLLKEYEDSNNKNVQAALKTADEKLCTLELELQYDNQMLKRTNGHIVVKINPDY